MSLTEAMLPEGLTNIGYGAFQECKGLTKVTLPDGLSVIGSRAFEGCIGLTEIIIPDSVLNISSGSFQNCEGLTKLEMGENIEIIGAQAFVGCPNLSEATIPSTITSVGDGPFDQSCTIYYQSTLENWRNVSGYYKVHYDQTGSYYGDGTNIYYGDDDVLVVRIKPDDVTLQTWHTYTLEASRSNAITEADSPKWTIDREQSDGTISIVSSYVREGKAYCLIVATGVGTCNVNVKVNGSYSAEATIHIVEEERPVTTITAVAGEASHLSGRKDYVLEDTSTGVINWSDPITSRIVMKAGSKYTADPPIIIKNRGELVTSGILEANKIEVKSGGTLDCMNGSVVVADEVIVNGGWLRVSGDLRAKKVTIKGGGRLDIEKGAQIVAKESFLYNGKEVFKLNGNLFIGGSMNVNKHFIASNSALNTVFYGDTSAHEFKFHQKSRIGNVFVKDEKSYNHIGIPADNLIGAMLYTDLDTPNYKKWTFKPDTKTGKLVVGWEGTLGAYYQNMQKEMQGAFELDSYTGLTQDECKYVTDLATIWTSTILPQLNGGFLDYNTKKCEIHFEIRGTEYKLTYAPTTWGSYASYGTVKFGLVDDENLKIIGGCAGGSQETFRAQAATYLSEEFVIEYLKLVNGSVPKSITQSSAIAKLKKMGKDAVIKGFKKILNKYLFSAHQTSYVGDGLSWIEKSFKLTNMIVEGDVVGLWKYAFDTADSRSSSVSNKRALYDIKANISEEEDVEFVNDAGNSAIAGITGNALSKVARKNVSDTVTDEFLKAALIERLGADSEGEPDWTRQADVTFLDLSGKYIESLDGIQHFTNLSTLILEGNEISDITALESMSSIKYLDISGQNIDDLSAISGLTEMLELDISDNPITSIEAVGGMTKLTKLEMKETNVDNLLPLTSLTELQYLDADNVEFTEADLSCLSGCSKLKEVRLEGCGLESLEGLNVTSLVTLNVCDNQIQNMTPLMSAASLKTLDLSENLLETVPSLAGCTALKTMDLSGNMLLDISGIVDAVGLRELNVSACELSDSDIETLAEISTLKSLDIAFNDIEDMSPLFNLCGLDTLNLSGTWVDLADYSNLPRNINYIDSFIVQSGTCADNKKWMVDSTGELTIYGTGKMQSYENADTPWPEAETVRIGEGITRVGDYSFASQTDLASVQLPSTLKAIGAQAFKDCTSLNNLFVPYCVTEIGNEAFNNESLVIYYAGSQDEWNALEKDRNLVYQKVICNRINLPDSITISQTSFEYTGEAHEPAVEIKSDEYTLVEGKDYTVAYLNNIRKGTATVRITGIGRYAGIVDKNFSIGSISIENAVVLEISDVAYTGNEIRPEPSVTLNGDELVAGTDFEVSYSDNLNAGTASVIITGINDYTGKIEKTFKITQSAQNITAKVASSTIAVGKTVKVTGSGNKGTLSFTSSDTKIATVDETKGVVTARKVGTVKITVNAAATDNYKTASKTVTVKVVPAATTQVKAANQTKGIKLTWKKVAGATGYKVYRGSKLVKTIKSGSTLTCTDTAANTNGSKYTFKVIATAATGISPLSKSVTTYRVSRPAISSLKNSASKKMTVKWGKNTKANGYQIQYSLKSNFASPKTVTIGKNTIVSKVIGSLTKGKKYYVRIRSYKTMSGKKHYSAWSALKSVTIKK